VRFRGSNCLFLGGRLNDFRGNVHLGAGAFELAWAEDLRDLVWIILPVAARRLIIADGSCTFLRGPHPHPISGPTGKADAGNYQINPGFSLVPHVDWSGFLRLGWITLRAVQYLHAILFTETGQESLARGRTPL